MNIEGMSKEELIRAKAEIDAAIAQEEVNRRAAALEAARAAASAAGYKLEDLLGEKPVAPKRKVAVKYRGPDGQTWTGRGRKPLWVIAALDAGKSLDEFAV